MSKFIAMIAVAFGVLSGLAIAMMFYGAATQAGMAVLAFQVWGVIAAVAALVLAFLSNLIAKKSDAPASRLPKLASLLGGLSLLALIIGLMFLG